MNNPSQKKILIADDEQDFITDLRIPLEAAGFQICTASEGIRAIEFAHKKNPDLILLDIHMPVGSGETVLQALRLKEDTKRIPIIVMTASEEPGLAQRIKSEGANDFLIKPFEISVLINKIRSLL